MEDIDVCYGISVQDIDLLRRSGWWESNLEDLPTHWHHKEVPGRHHPDDAVRITKERLQEFKGEF